MGCLRQRCLIGRDAQAFFFHAASNLFQPLRISLKYLPEDRSVVRHGGSCVRN
jgi:hypothetical protein